jgi:acetyl-CoA acetyltransferase
MKRQSLVTVLINVTVTNGPTGALDAVSCAGVYLEAGRAKAILAGGAEASSELLWDSLHRVGALHDSGESAWDASSRRGVGTVSTPAALSTTITSSSSYTSAKARLLTTPALTRDLLVPARC